MNVNWLFHPVETEQRVKIVKVTMSACVLSFGREKTAKTVGIFIAHQVGKSDVLPWM